MKKYSDIRGILTLVLLSTLLVMACKSQKKVSTQPETSNLIRLETHPCLGYCPIYKLTFRNDGLIEYEGIRFVKKIGPDTVRLTQEQLHLLQTKVKNVNLWQYPERIKSNVVDAGSATLTVFEAEKSHSVQGSIDRPKAILDLEQLMQGLAEAHGLSVKEGVNPNELPASQREIIIQFKPEVNPGNWLMQFQEIKLRLVKRVSADNIWLVGYDPAQIQENQLIDLMKDMDGVVKVQANQQAKERN